LAPRDWWKFDPYSQATMHTLCGTKPLTATQRATKWTVGTLCKRQTNGECDLFRIHFVAARKLGEAHDDASHDPQRTWPHDGKPKHLGVPREHIKPDFINNRV